MAHGGPSGGCRQLRHSQRRNRSQDPISHKEAQVTFEVLSYCQRQQRALPSRPAGALGLCRQ